jgi:hypothetical protein
MSTITADDVLVLARSEHPDAVLAVMNGEAAVLPAGEAGDATVVYTREDLVAEFGQEITEIEAVTLAAGLTAQVADD